MLLLDLCRNEKAPARAAAAAAADAGLPVNAPEMTTSCESNVAQSPAHAVYTALAKRFSSIAQPHRLCQCWQDPARRPVHNLGAGLRSHTITQSLLVQQATQAEACATLGRSLHLQQKQAGTSSKNGAAGGQGNPELGTLPPDKHTALPRVLLTLTSNHSPQEILFACLPLDTLAPTPSSDKVFSTKHKFA